MNTKVESSSPENRFPGRLARKAILILPSITLLPGITVIIDLLIFSKFSNPVRIAGILITSLLLGLFFAFILNRFFKRQIITPIEEIIETVRHFTLGDLKERTHLKHDNEIGLLANMINQVGETLYDRFYELEIKLNAREIQLRTTSDLANIAANATNLEQLLQQTANLITERFNHHKVEIYLLNQTYDQAMLKAVSGLIDQSKVQEEETIPISEGTHFDWVVKHNHPKIFSQSDLESMIPLISYITDSKSAAAIPISSDDSVIGIIHIQDRKANAISHDEIGILHTIAKQIVTTINNRFNIEADSVPFAGDTFLYHASHAIITADSEAQVFTTLRNTLKQMPLSVALFIQDQDYFTPLLLTDQSGQEISIPQLSDISIPTFSIEALVHETSPIIITKPDENRGLPESLVSISQKLPFEPIRLYPLINHLKLAGFLFLGATEVVQFSSIELETIQRLVEITITSLEKIDAIQTISNQLVELQTLNTVSQSISTITNLEKLYEVIHQQINHVMGSVNFLIALYNGLTNSIEIPYMDDGNAILHVPPFPLGQGLTSIIIRTRQPLMIVEDTINRSRALGAIVTGDKPALSWLGVPMLLRDELIGAIVVQDLEKEHRFDENDMRLLTTLSAQVAIAVWNTRLIEIAQKRSLRDHQLYEITNKIRDEIDIQGVLSTTAQELSKALSARRASIKISSDAISPVSNGNGNSRSEEFSA